MAICRRLDGTILQAVETVLHLGDAAFEPCCQGFIGKRRADDGGDNLVQVGQALDRIGEGLLIDLGVFRPDAVADGAVGDGGKFQGHGVSSKVTMLRTPLAKSGSRIPLARPAAQTVGFSH